MPVFRPHYRLTLYKPRSQQAVYANETEILEPRTGALHADRFRVTTKPGVSGWRPYLAHPEKGRRGRVDFKSGKTDIGAMTFYIGDPRIGEDSTNAERWLTQFWGDEGAKVALGKCLVRVEESLDDGGHWTPFYVGRVEDADQADRLALKVATKDLSGDLDQTIFLNDPWGNTGLTSDLAYARRVPLSPWGLLASFATLPAETSVLFGEMDYDAGDKLRRVRLRGESDHKKRAMISTHLRDLATSYSTHLTSALFEYDRSLKMRVSVAGVFHGWFWVRQILAVRRWDMWVPDYYDIEEMDGGAAVPADGTDIRFQVFDAGPVNAGSPILLDNVHIVELLQDLVDGHFGPLNDDGTPRHPVARDASSWAPLLADATLPRVTAIIDEPANLREFVETRLARAARLALHPGPDGKVRLLDLRRPTTIAGLATITDADLVGAPGNALTRYAAGEAVTSIELRTQKFESMTLEQLEDLDEDFPDVPGSGLATSARKEIHLALGDTRTLDFGRKPYEIDMTALSMPKANGGTKGAPTVIQTALKLRHLMERLVLDFFAMFDRGATYHTVLGRRASQLEDIEVGDRALLACRNLLDPVTNLRGGTRVGVCVDKQEDDGRIVGVFADLGASDAADVPTSTALTADADPALCPHYVHQDITLNADGDPVRVDYATVPIGDPRPADASALWTFFRQVTATTADLAIGPLPSGLRVYTRIRSEPGSGSGLSLPSAWVVGTPEFVDLCAIDPPTGCAIVVTNGVRMFTWTNGDPTRQSEITADGTVVAVVAAGSTQYPLNNLPIGASSVAVAHIDAFGGRSSSCAQAYTTGATVQAPRPAGFDILEPSANRLALFPARDPAFPGVYFHWLIQRAPDDGSGLAPDLGAIETIEAALDLGGDIATYDDANVLTGDVFWYRVAHVLTGFLDSEFLEWQKAIATVGTTPPPVVIMPTYTETRSVVGSTGTLTVGVTDPQGRFIQIEFKTQAGSAAETAYAVDAAEPFEASVALVEGEASTISYRVTAYDGDGVPRIVHERTVVFNGGADESWTLPTFVTWGDETPTPLPNSRRLADSDDITWDLSDPDTITGTVSAEAFEGGAVQQVPTEWAVYAPPPGDRVRVVAVPAAETEISEEWRDWWPLVGIRQGRMIVQVIEGAAFGTIGKVQYSLDGLPPFADLGIEIPLHLAGTRKSNWANIDAGALGADALLTIATEGGDAATDLRLGAVRVQWAAFADLAGPLPQSEIGFDDTDLLHYYESFNATTLDGSNNATQMQDQVSGLHYGNGNPPATEIDGTLGIRVLRFLSGTYLELANASHVGRTAGHIFMLLRSDYQIAAPSASGIWTYGPTHERYKSDVFGAADFSYGRTGTVFPPVDPYSITIWHLVEVEAGGGYWAMRTTRAGVTTTHREDLAAVSHGWNTGAIRLGVSSSLGINGFYRMALLAEFSDRQDPTNAEAFREYVRTLLPAAGI
jgi:hypothetical protein